MTFAKIKYSGILLLLVIWYSLDTNIQYSISLIPDTRSFVVIIAIIRSLAPYLIFCFFLFFSRQISFKTKNKNLNIVIIALILNFLIQAVCLFIYQEEQNLNNLNLIILTFISLTLFSIQYNLNYTREIFIISILILSSVVLWFGSVMIIWYFSDGNLTANLYGGWPHSFITNWRASENIPRSSGIARSSLVIMIPILLRIASSNFIYKKNDFYFYIVYLFMFFLVYMTQSRITLFAALLITLMSIIYIFSSNIKKIKKLIFIIIIPSLLILLIINIKLHTISKNQKVLDEIKKMTIEKSISEDQAKTILGTQKKYGSVLRSVNKKSFTSNRFSDWKNIIKKNDSTLFGVGVMGDRFLINQSASNLLLYTYSSSGIIGSILIGLLLLRSFFVCSKILLFNEKKLNIENSLLLSACYIQYFLLGRSLIESSFAVFGIDFLIFFSAYFYTEQYNDKQKTNEKV